jgi:hypothetical protein
MQLPPSFAMLLFRLERAANPRSTLIALRSWALRRVICSVFGLKIVSCFGFIGVNAILFLTRCVAFEYICVLSLHHLSTHSCSGLFARRCVVYSCRSNLFVVVCCCSCLQLLSFLGVSGTMKPNCECFLFAMRLISPPCSPTIVGVQLMRCR